MPEPGSDLGPDEEAILEIYKVRLVGKGVGLTHDVLVSELKWLTADELDAALAGLIQKGLLSNPAFYQKIYILTAAGKGYIDSHLSPI